MRANAKKCPKCGSKKLSKPEKKSVYKLIIKRQKRNEMSEDERSKI
jgi:DNA-directed RNA polymerase subunit RPC12/RpoP